MGGVRHTWGIDLSTKQNKLTLSRESAGHTLNSTVAESIVDVGQHPDEKLGTVDVMYEVADQRISDQRVKVFTTWDDDTRTTWGRLFTAQ